MEHIVQFGINIDDEAIKRTVMESGVKTKGCPFCGGEVEERGGTCNYGKKVMTLDVKCQKCETTFKFKHKWVVNPYVETVDVWNRRYDDGTTA